MRVVAIIPAGGSGKRSGLSKPKQYIKVNDKEILVYTLEIFQMNKNIDGIIIAAAADYLKKVNYLVKKHNLSKLVKIVEGGKERQDSVFNALSSFNFNDEDLIVVHDAARPLLPQKTLTLAINNAKKNGNALVSVKAKDTLLKGSDIVNSYLNRDEVYYVQTPQIFKYKDLMRAMLKAQKDKFDGTDESMLVKRTGKKVYLSEGSTFNFKITYKEDIELFKKIINSSK